jgi:hypothetical protein
MKSFLITIFAGLVAATCDTPGTVAVLPPANTAGYVAAYNIVSGKGTLEACRAECYSSANAQCRSFGIRSTFCYLFDIDLSSKIIPRDTSTYTYYPLAAGIVGWVPENVAQHYYADTSKTKGNYAGCRQLCINDSQCKGFGYKNGGDCQLYNVSLQGKVHADPTSPYIQWLGDCIPR